MVSPAGKITFWRYGSSVSAGRSAPAQEDQGRRGRPYMESAWIPIAQCVSFVEINFSPRHIAMNVIPRRVCDDGVDI